jgi:hypothetical protein
MDLQNKIQTAIQGNSTLAGTGLTVTVGPSAIQIAGTVQNTQQKEAALRLVQSFARNRSVVDRVTVLNTTPPSFSQPQTTQPQTQTLPPANQPSTAPQTRGDESTTTPR